MKTIFAVAAAVMAPGNNPMDRISLDQLMRVSTLPPARIHEMQCGGLAQWLAANRKSDLEAPSPTDAARLSEAVAAALANDAELPVDLAREFVAGFGNEVNGKLAELPAAEGKAWLADKTGQCSALFKSAREPGAIKLHPLANASVVSPSLATCYGLYKAAASRASGTEAEALARDAEQAAKLALDGKEGAARAAAETALAAEAAAALSAPRSDGETEMMRLVVCQPHLRGIAMPRGN